ncbi:MAG TPA: protein kinase [Gemmatimonadaceae bacterium]|nr:protein kinase [Gemmatimonadaceae bacterium]
MPLDHLPSGELPPGFHTLEEDFELLRELGRGAFTAVYLARERATARLVAIKTIRRRYLDDEEAVHRFAREARVVADLNHPNIVRTYGVREMEERTVAIVLQHIQGPTLRDALHDDQPFPIPLAERVLNDVAAALVYAHGRGVVHRDVKPENIFLDEETGRVLLADFGIARTMDGDPHLTRVGMVVGTPAYMSPKQIDGRAVDGRSDVYSLGVVGWEMLTGQRPWAGQSIYNVMYKHKHEPLTSIASLRPEAPRVLRFAVEAAMRKDRDRRGDASDLIARMAAREREAMRIAAIDAQIASTTAQLRHLAEREVWASAPSPWRARVPLALIALFVLAGTLFAADFRRVRREGTLHPFATLSRTDSLRLCDTPSAPYQRACLAAKLSDSDVEVERAYQALFVELRRQAPASTRAGLSPTRQLSSEHQAWLAARHRDCRVDSAELAGGRWALGVSRCLADRAALRSAKLRERLSILQSAR